MLKLSHFSYRSVLGVTTQYTPLHQDSSVFTGKNGCEENENSSASSCIVEKNFPETKQHSDAIVTVVL
jgi:hypothetical protein